MTAKYIYGRRPSLDVLFRLFMGVCAKEGQAMPEEVVNAFKVAFVAGFLQMSYVGDYVAQQVSGRRPDDRKLVDLARYVQSLRDEAFAFGKKHAPEDEINN